MILHLQFCICAHYTCVVGAIFIFFHSSFCFPFLRTHSYTPIHTHTHTHAYLHGFVYMFWNDNIFVGKWAENPLFVELYQISLILDYKLILFIFLSFPTRLFVVAGSYSFKARL